MPDMTTTLRETHRRDAALLEQIEGNAGRTFALREARAAAQVSSADVRRLLRSGWLRRVGRGHFTIASRPMVASDDRLRLATALYAAEPHYISWWAALSYHGLTEQDPLHISVAVTRRHRDRRVGPLRIHPVIQSHGRFYGQEARKNDLGGELWIASPEKAIIDSLDRPDLGGGLREVVKTLGTTGYDPARLGALARRHPSEALVARLGYLLTVLDSPVRDDLLDLVRRRRPPVRLDIESGPGGVAIVDSTWRVLDTIGPDAIRAWARL